MAHDEWINQWEIWGFICNIFQRAFVNWTIQLFCRRGETRVVFSVMKNDEVRSSPRENVRNQRFAIAKWDSEILLTIG